MNPTPQGPTPEEPTGDEVRLRALLADAVADLEPADRRDAIRARTAAGRSGQTTTSPARTRPLAVLGAAAATAAVIGVVVWGGGAIRGGETPPVAHEPTSSATPSPGGEAFETRVFYVGDTPQGLRLYSEVRTLSPGADRASRRAVVLAAAQAALQLAPLDPDYQIPWPSGSRVEAVDVEGRGHGSTVRVRLSADVPSQRPDPMTPLMAELAVQQVVHTVVPALGEPARVEFWIGDRPASQVLGVDTSEPKSPADPLEILAPVQIAVPAEGARVKGRMLLSGEASSFEATVPWQIRSGADVVLDGWFTAEGWLDDLFPYAGEIDLAELEPGTYTLVVSTADPSGGEGGGPATDTRTFTIE